MSGLKLGFGLCGSFCTFEKAMAAMEVLWAAGYDIHPIFSETAYETDTRFGKAADWVAQAEALTGHKAIHTIGGAEPIGPKSLLDILLVAPCTGNTLAKLACGITDNCITMACKAHLRNEKPVVIALATNDGLAGSAPNIGRLLSRKHLYFVPFRQDDPKQKPTSLVADMSRIPETLAAAMIGRQIQPVML